MNVKLWFTGQETPLARRYSRLPKSRGPVPVDFLWVPRSVVEGTVRKLPPEPGTDEWPEHHFKVADWYGEREGL